MTTLGSAAASSDQDPYTGRTLTDGAIGMKNILVSSNGLPPLLPAEWARQGHVLRVRDVYVLARLYTYNRIHCTVVLRVFNLVFRW